MQWLLGQQVLEMARWNSLGEINSVNRRHPHGEVRRIHAGKVLERVSNLMHGLETEEPCVIMLVVAQGIQRTFSA